MIVPISGYKLPEQMCGACDFVISATSHKCRTLSHIDQQRREVRKRYETPSKLESVIYLEFVWSICIPKTNIVHFALVYKLGYHVLLYGPLIYNYNMENYRNVVDIEQYLPTTYTSEYVTGNFVIKIITLF